METKRKYRREKKARGKERTVSETARPREREKFTRGSAVSG